MEYVRKVDFAAFEASAQRMTQPMVDKDMGASTCTINCIKTPAGEGSPMGIHVHPVDQYFYVLGGVMSIEIEGKELEAGPGTMIFFPAGVPHRNWNAGTEATLHLAIQVPAPDPSVPFATTVG
jgi:mannose-6-phosphate isomerase-like protein (cupin superfamily)